MALPRDPYAPQQACNGVCLIPAGHGYVYEDWDGTNDMEWMRRQEHVMIDDLFPGQVQSFKGAVRDQGSRRHPHRLLPRQTKAARAHRALDQGALALRAAFVLGGASCVWADVEAALDLGEFAGVVAATTSASTGPAVMDAWVACTTATSGCGGTPAPRSAIRPTGSP
jgi:hypothetical protein